MKAITIMVSVAFSLSIASFNTYAQKLYVKIDAGYGIKFSSQSIDYFNFTNFNIDTSLTHQEQVTTSLGKGYTFEAAIGYMFHKNIGIELSGSFLLGTQTNTRQVLYGSVRNNNLSANMIRINPSVIISAGFEKINPYAKFGLIIGFGSILYQDDYTSSGGRLISEKMVLNGGVALGLNAGLGVSFKLNKTVSLFGEFNMINLSYAPVRGKLTKSTVDGVDRLPDMNTDDKEIDFVSSYSKATNDPNSHSDPRKELKEKFPFGSIGINLGISFNFK